MQAALRSVPIPGYLKYECYDSSLALWGDSKMLLVGGVQNGTYLPLIRICDLSTDCWSTFSCGLHTARANSSVVFNDRLYVFGGALQGDETTCEIVDLIDSTVTKVTQPMAWQRTKCVGYRGKKIILVGGCDRNQATDECWCFDTTTRIFHRLASMETKRCRPAVGLYNDLLIVVGGLNEDLGSWLSSCEVYHIPSDAWSELEDMPVSEKILASFVHDSSLFVVSKAATFSYDLLNHYWTAQEAAGFEDLTTYQAVHVPFDDLLVWTTPKNLVAMSIPPMVVLQDVEGFQKQAMKSSPDQPMADPETEHRPPVGPRFKDQAVDIPFANLHQVTRIAIFYTHISSATKMVRLTTHHVQRDLATYRTCKSYKIVPERECISPEATFIASKLAGTPIEDDSPKSAPAPSRCQ